jgi:hypothetical protein
MDEPRARDQARRGAHSTGRAADAQSQLRRGILGEMTDEDAFLAAPALRFTVPDVVIKYYVYLYIEYNL